MTTCQYDYKWSSEDGSRANNQDIMYFKYIFDMDTVQHYPDRFCIGYKYLHNHHTYTGYTK
jgi:hypothetical protein